MLTFGRMAAPAWRARASAWATRSLAPVKSVLSRTASSTRAFSSSLPKPRYQSWAGHEALAAAARCSNAAGVTGGGCGALSVAQPHASAADNATVVSQRPAAALWLFAEEGLTASAYRIRLGTEVMTVTCAAEFNSHPHAVRVTVWCLRKLWFRLKRCAPSYTVRDETADRRGLRQAVRRAHVRLSRGRVRRGSCRRRPGRSVADRGARVRCDDSRSDAAPGLRARSVACSASVAGADACARPLGPQPDRGPGRGAEPRSRR